jgi:NifU-like protein involved in Fe-S cluster formation
MSAAAALYTPEVLALATGLASYPLDEGLTQRGSARSPSCGSSLDLGLTLDAAGRIERVGLRSHACAIGQAAAAIFASAAVGRDREAIAAAKIELEAWLAGGDLPHWPGLEVLARTQAYPARHAAVMLPWKAALGALPSTETGR